jgi:steroid delta-isomerase-like uncharacterized protein
MTPKQVVKEWAAAYNRHDPSAAAALYHENAANLQIPWNKTVQGRQAMFEVFSRIMRAFPDIHTEIEALFEDGEWVTAEWNFGGTMLGEFAGHAPTGRSFNLRGCEIFRVTDGQICLQRGYWDKATWFGQLGLPMD